MFWPSLQNTQVKSFWLYFIVRHTILLSGSKLRAVMNGVAMQYGASPRLSATLNTDAIITTDRHFAISFLSKLRLSIPLGSFPGNMAVRKNIS
jgi:hypothetical protein